MENEEAEMSFRKIFDAAVLILDSQFSILN